MCCVNVKTIRLLLGSQLDVEINPTDLPGITIDQWQVTEYLDPYFHTKRGVCVQGASLIAEKRMHADRIFLCRMKAAVETDSKVFFLREVS